MKCDQDLCMNFWYDFKKLLWQDELNPRVCCAFGNVLTFQSLPDFQAGPAARNCWDQGWGESHKNFKLGLHQSVLDIRSEQIILRLKLLSFWLDIQVWV